MAKAKAKKVKHYSAKDVRFLKGLEPVRIRPSMYIPDADMAGFHHLIKEVVDNGIDEFLDGHVNRIVVTVNTKTNVVQVRDNGRGIPVEKHPDTKESTLTGVFTRLHAGTKFGKGAYTSAIIGLHGIGVKATCALSENLQVWTVQRGKTYTQQFERGKPTSEVVIAEQKIKKGTAVVFRPDPQIFGDVKVNPKRIRKWLRDTAYLCPGLKITFKVDGKKEVFYAKKGLEDLCHLLTEGEELLHEFLVLQHKEFDMVLVWANVEGEHWKSWVNVSPTPEHGTHVNGVKKAVQNVFSEHAGKRLKGEDIRDGLVGFVHAHVLEPKFRGQAKVRLENKDVGEWVQEIAENVLRRFVAENPVVAKSIIERAVELSKARTKFRSEQKAIKGTRVKSGAKGIMPDKLFECPDAPSEDRELFIVEGDSAAGTVVDGRVMLKQKKGKPLHYQEVYALRGKLLNVARKEGLEGAMKNKEIEGLVKTLGTGVGPSFNIAKARHSKIFILTDADPDGKHIRSLLIVLFSKLFPQLIDDGLVHIVRNPLFRGVTPSKTAYGDTAEDVQKKLGTSNCRISRFKGLGEMNPLDMRTSSLDPKTRDVVQVLWEDANDRDLVLEYMGPDASVRKEILGVVE
jgi:DNA gyrase/topoisomerase IV subunit B